MERCPLRASATPWSAGRQLLAHWSGYTDHHLVAIVPPSQPRVDPLQGLVPLVLLLIHKFVGAWHEGPFLCAGATLSRIPIDINDRLEMCRRLRRETRQLACRWRSRLQALHRAYDFGPISDTSSDSDSEFPVLVELGRINRERARRASINRTPIAVHRRRAYAGTRGGRVLATQQRPPWDHWFAATDDDDNWGPAVVSTR